MTLVDSPAPFVDQVAQAVVARLFGSSTAAIAQIGRVSHDVRSFGMPLEVRGDGDARSVYIKIPTQHPHLRRTGVASISDEDRVLAQQELEALRYLEDHWQAADLGVGFVTPLAYVQDCNALVLERVHGRSILRRLQRRDLLRRLLPGTRDEEGAHMVARLSQALGRFHADTMGDGEDPSTLLREEVGAFAHRLVRAGIARDKLSRATVRVAELIRRRTPPRIVAGIGGLSLGSFLVGNRGRLTGLDPQSLMPALPEEDVARLIADIRCLHWPSRHARFIRPDPSLEQAVQHGYQAVIDIEPRALSACLIHQILQRWAAAADTTGRLRWTRRLATGIRPDAVNSFFENLLEELLTASPST